MYTVLLVGIGIAAVLFICLMAGSDDDDRHGRG